MNKVLQEDLDQVLNSGMISQFPELHKSIHIKRFTIKDVGITHRWITHWDDEDLLFYPTEKGKWRKFNLVEFVWLKIIVELRKFDVPLNVIKALKENLKYDNLDFKSLINDPTVQELLLAMGGDENQDFIKDYIASGELSSDIDKNAPLALNAIEILVLQNIVLKSHISLLINLRGEVVPLRLGYVNELSRMDGFERFMYDSYISIPISKIISDFISGNNTDLISDKLQLLTFEETRVLELLRQDEITEMKIKLSKLNEIDFIELTREEKVNKANRFSDIIMNNGYQEITAKTQGGEIVHCKNTYKIKFERTG